MAPRSIFDRFLGPFWGPKIVKFGLEICLKIEHRFGTRFFSHLEGSGGRLGLDLGLILGSILGSPGERQDF